MFIAKFDRRFLQDENGHLAAIDCFCLKEKIGTITTTCWRMIKEIIVTSNVICGPLACSFDGREKWLIEQHCDVKKFFEIVKNLDRKQVYNKFICKI